MNWQCSWWTHANSYFVMCHLVCFVVVVFIVVFCHMDFFCKNDVFVGFCGGSWVCGLSLEMLIQSWMPRAFCTLGQILKSHKLFGSGPCWVFCTLAFLGQHGYWCVWHFLCCHPCCFLKNIVASLVWSMLCFGCSLNSWSEALTVHVCHFGNLHPSAFLKQQIWMPSLSPSGMLAGFFNY